MWYICHIDGNSLEHRLLIMRILLIATNRHNRWMTKDEVRPLPIGLAYVAAYINSDRHSVRILDLMFSEDHIFDTAQAVKEYRPDIVGISLRNLEMVALLILNQLYLRQGMLYRQFERTVVL